MNVEGVMMRMKVVHGRKDEEKNGMMIRRMKRVRMSLNPIYEFRIFQVAWILKIRS